MDGEALAVTRRYHDADADEVLAQFRRARVKTSALIFDLNPEQLARVAEFEGRAVTLRGLVHNLCSHDHQHLAGLQWLLARLAATHVG
ncbi:MAG TPA: DinB family protein [Steroidobacteraceae bacterium]|nr:DinB family protein [Steroidobacteraceae bacterium]